MGVSADKLSHIDEVGGLKVDVVVLSEERLERTPDGVVFGPSSYQFWSRYLEVFDRVRIVARLRDVKGPTGQNTIATGLNIMVHPVPHHLGPLEYMKVSRRVAAAVRNSFLVGDAVIMRLSCHIADPLFVILRRLGAPYGVEVVGDPYEVFAPGVVAHPLRPLFRWWFTRQQQRYCAGASAAAYVTQRTLQKRYPCGSYAIGVSDVQIRGDISSDGILSTHYSSINLAETYLQTEGTRGLRLGGPFRLITVGSLEQLYKGTHILIQAVAKCLETGVDVTLTIVGDGKFRAMLEASATKLGIASRVSFAGAVRGADAVKVCLDGADLFVLPSLTEGLPRALIEAMARGLPCIASAVGGIPELLPREDLFPPANVSELAAKIVEVMADADQLKKMSARNLLRAGEFREPILRERRIAFYRHLRRQTDEWMGSDAALVR